MKDIIVGDEVCNSNGGVSHVTAKYNPPTTQMYRITLSDGRSCIACQDHLWTVGVKRDVFKTFTTQELHSIYKGGQYRLPLPRPIYHTKKFLEVEPYLFGTFCRDWESIPDNYLYSTIEDRMELLRGLLSKGTYIGKNIYILMIYGEKFGRDLVHLVTSLGGYIHRRSRMKRCSDSSIRYRIKLPHLIRTPDGKYRNDAEVIRIINAQIDKVEPIDYTGDIYCITVDSPDSLYLIEDNILTHNTHAICQRYANIFLTEPNVMMAVVMADLPALRRTVYHGDPSIIKTIADWGIPVKNKFSGWWNKTENVIENPMTGSKMWFVGLDDPEKIKSMNLNYLYLEEATALSLDKFTQLDTRLRRPNPNNKPNQMFIAYNPISIYNWVVQTFVVSPSPFIKDNTCINFSNFTQNPYLPVETIAMMLDKASVDKNYYFTYLIGKPGIPEGQIYRNFIFTPRNGVKSTNEQGEEFYIVPPWDNEIWQQKPYYGIDWGYNDPTCIVECRDYKGTIYVINRYYERHRSMEDIIAAMKRIGITSSHYIYCDHAEADRIAKLEQEGFCAMRARKDVHAGITYLQGKRVVVDSTGEYGDIARKEIESYSWAQDKNDSRVYLDEPAEDQEQHYCDGFRYAAFSHHYNGEFSVGAYDPPGLQTHSDEYQRLLDAMTSKMDKPMERLI